MKQSKYFCDICKKEIKNYDDGIYVNWIGEVTVRFDLCKSCNKKLKNFLNYEEVVRNCEEEEEGD